MHIYELSYQNDFHYVRLCEWVGTPVASAFPDVIGDGCGCLPLWALVVHRTSHARLMDFLIKS